MIHIVVKAIDRGIGKVYVTPSSGTAYSVLQRGFPDCVRCSIRLMSKSQVGLGAKSPKAIIVDIRCIVIVFVALGVSTRDSLRNRLLTPVSQSSNH